MTLGQGVRSGVPKAGPLEIVLASLHALSRKEEQEQNEKRNLLLPFACWFAPAFCVLWGYVCSLLLCPANHHPQSMAQQQRLVASTLQPQKTHVRRRGNEAK